MIGSSADRLAAFRRLHDAGRPLLLPNAWDFASAAAFTAAGYPAVGTTSLGVAAAAGKADAAATTRPETVKLTRLLGRLPVLLTVDIEGGFSDDPAAVADLAAELHDAGAVGVNLEDGRPDGALQPVLLHARKIEMVKRQVPDLFVNARTDAYWLPGSTAQPPLAETLRRGAAYTAAGADGYFVPGLADADIRTVAEAVPAPLNVLHRPGVGAAAGAANSAVDWAALGVARISTGSLLFRVALQAAVDAAARLGQDTGEDRPLPSYDDVQRLIGSW